MLEPGAKIDHFTLHKRMGYGSSGEVWRAHDGAREVALKFLNAELLKSKDSNIHRIRFHNEVRALERLIRVKNVPTLYGYNLNHERPYLAMALIDAPSWSHLIASGQMMSLPVIKRLSLLRIIARTIMQVHANDVIHRDIKPTNIHDVDHPYIIDFSVAIDRKHAPQARLNVGTGLYMPPPDGGTPDEMTDYFGFALVAYEVLFGQHAVLSPEFFHTDFQEVRQIMQQRLVNGTWNKPSQLSEIDLPGGLKGADLQALDQIFGRALGNREQRYTDMVRFVDDLYGAITVTSNQPYIDYVPDVPLAGNSIPKQKDYTLHEVRNAYTHTNLRAQGHPRMYWLVFGLVVWALAVVALFILVLATR